MDLGYYVAWLAQNNLLPAGGAAGVPGVTVRQLSAMYARDVRAGRPDPWPGSGMQGPVMTPEEILTQQLLAQGYAREDVPGMVRKRLVGMSCGPAGGPQYGQEVNLPGGMTFRPIGRPAGFGG